MASMVFFQILILTKETGAILELNTLFKLDDNEMSNIWSNENFYDFFDN